MELRENYEAQLAQVNQDIVIEKNFITQLHEHELGDARKSVRLDSTLNR